MANNPPSLAETKDFDGHPLPVRRAPVTLVVGSGSVTADDLYPLLRRRLLIVTSIVCGIFILGVALDFLEWRIGGLLIEDSQGNPVTRFSQWLLLMWRAFATFAIVGICAIVLWRWPPTSVRGLRTIEIVMFGWMVLMTLTLSVGPGYTMLGEAAEFPTRIRQRLEAAYINGGSHAWFVLFTLYGALIPNNWRRCAIVLGLISVAVLAVFAIHAYWLRPLDPETANPVMRTMAFSLLFALVVAVFASSRIEILRQQVAEARKLGQYILKERLGMGGMGEVYRAEHVLLRRPCAVKMIRPESALDPTSLRRFEREVQVTATLTHPNTVQVYDYGHAADGTFYYVMEYLPGPTISRLVKRDGPLSPERTVHLLRQICGALAEAHSVGLIHRDIKPGNIIVCERGGIPDVAKLLDFGLVAAPSPEPGVELTVQGQTPGTPAYMSPEQAAGLADCDRRSDIYSLGATAYFMLAGKPPFERATQNLVIAAHLHEPVIPLDEVNPALPSDLCAIVGRCLEKDRERRYPDACSLEQALLKTQTAQRLVDA